MMARDSDTPDGARRGAGRAADGAPPPPPAPAGALRLAGRGRGAARHSSEPDAAGVRRPGLVMRRAAAGARSRAPADAVVRYAGPFLEYGYVVVLEPDAETMVVLAGLAQVRVRTGAQVAAGRAARPARRAGARR